MTLAAVYCSGNVYYYFHLFVIFKSFFILSANGKKNNIMSWQLILLDHVGRPFHFVEFNALKNKNIASWSLDIRLDILVRKSQMIINLTIQLIFSLIYILLWGYNRNSLRWFVPCTWSSNVIVVGIYVYLSCTHQIDSLHFRYSVFPHFLLQSEKRTLNYLFTYLVF